MQVGEDRELGKHAITDIANVLRSRRKKIRLQKITFNQTVSYFKTLLADYKQFTNDHNTLHSELTNCEFDTFLNYGIKEMEGYAKIYEQLETSNESFRSLEEIEKLEANGEIVWQKYCEVLKL